MSNKSEDQQDPAESDLKTVEPDPKTEEPAPAKAKPSQPPAKVTAPPKSKKVKNPKRVAAGKALAAKNKERVAKMLAFEKSQKVEAEQEPPQNLEKSQSESEMVKNDGWSTSTSLLVGGMVIVGGLATFGYQKIFASKNQKNENPAPALVLAPKEKKSNLFDDF